MKSAYRGAVEEWTQIHEDCLKEGSGKVDTDTRRLHKRGLWKSGHRYMNSGDRRAVVEWTQIYKQCLQEGSGRMDTGT